ncbi:MAG: 2-C-methyl-D-erythritol 4-phosphate cytidylyltransferase [bacterium]|jgi:2-C-methyl-D-erythritol 4-phosphate cytidylyltransferase
MAALQITAIVPAAGRGTRMLAASPKQFLPLADKPVLIHTLEVLASCSLLDDIVLVADSEHVSFCRDELLPAYNLSKVKAVVPGGTERQISVFRGLEFLRSCPPDLVLVHDGVRPLVPRQCVYRVIETAVRKGAAVLAVPVKDTVKVAGETGTVLKTLDRRQLWAAQTPQVFSYPLLYRAHEQARWDGYRGTDDASLLERIGAEVTLTAGSYENIKITTPEDLAWAAAILRGRGDE